MDIDQNVQKIIKAVLSKWKFLLIFAVVGAILAYGYTANFTKMTYTSTIEFLAYAVDKQTEVTETEENPNNTRISETSKMNYAMKMITTYVEIFNTNEFCNDVADGLTSRIGKTYSGGTVKGAMTVEVVEDTAMFKAVVTTGDPELSYQLACELQDKIPERMKKTNDGLVMASVEDPPIKASSAVSLNYPKRCLIGGIAGIILAAAIVILRDLIDIRIKDTDDLSEKYNIPILGTVPEFNLKKSFTKTKGGNKNG